MNRGSIDAFLVAAAPPDRSWVEDWMAGANPASLREIWLDGARTVRPLLTQARARLAENRRWNAAHSWKDLCEMGAQWCEGKVQNNPGHPDRDPETLRIEGPLAHANRQGFLTFNSQPGEGAEGREGHQQKAMVEGWVPAATLPKLRNLINGTRLKMQVHEGRLPWRHDYSQSFDMTRHIFPDGDMRVFSDGGVIPNRRTIGIDYGHPELIAHQRAAFVILHDPEWGDHSLLWDRLAEPDWDNPRPPAAPTKPVERKPTEQPRRGAGTPTQGSGAGMSSIEEVRGGIAAAVDQVNEANGALQQAVQTLEQAQGQLQAAVEGSGQADASEALGLIGQAKQSAEESQQSAQGAVQAAESVAARL